MICKTFTQFLEEKEGKKVYDFSSVLYNLPGITSKKIIRWGNKNIKDEDLFKDPEDPTFGRENEIHCTVIYGIHDTEPDYLKKILKNVKPFDIKLGKISSFTNPEKFDVIKVEVTGTRLHKLHDLIRDDMEVTESFPEYKPHVTIAYLKKGKSKQYVGDDSFKDLTMKVDKLVFSSSSGFKIPISLNHKS